MTDEDIRAALLVAGDDEGRPRGFAIDEVVARGRRRRRTPWVVAGAAAAALVVAGAAGPQLLGNGDEGGGGAAQCAAVIDFDGARYVGHGDLMSEPATTGRSEEGRSPRCDDGGGAVPASTVVVEELADLPMARGFLSDGQVYLREGEPFPERIRPWFKPKSCGVDAPTELRGRWTGVMSSKKVRFDGDIRAPLLIDLRIDPDSPGAGEYAGWQIRIHDTGSADPSLTKADVEDALWSDAPLTVRVHCEGERWVADGFRVER
jgi:hypothetical protein